MDSCIVVIVTYNNEHTIHDCLHSLFEHSSVPLFVVVVDNSPGLQTTEAIRMYQKQYPAQPIVLIERHDNPGFAKGCNVGAFFYDNPSHSRAILFLNPDTRCENDVPGLLMHELYTKERVSVIGPQVCTPQGKIEITCRNLPTPLRIFCDATGIDRYLGWYRLFGFDHAREQTVDQVIGACFMVKRDEFLSLGGFDEQFFVYYEEVDYCKRVLAAGHNVLFYPAARITHAAGSSCETLPVVDKMPGMLRKSRFQYFAKHFGAIPQLLVLVITLLECLVKSAVYLVFAALKPNSQPFFFAKSKGFWAVVKEWNR